MSGVSSRFGSMLPKMASGRLFNAAGAAGPRRLMVIAGIGIALAATIAAVVVTGSPAPNLSKDARMPSVDPLPGGLYSTPEQDALAKQANDANADAAHKNGVSYTPPIAPSQRTIPPELQVERAAAPKSSAHFEPVAVFKPASDPVPGPLRVVFPAPLARPSKKQVVEQLRPVLIDAPVQTEQAAQAAYNKAINDLFSQWGGRVPRTDVILPPVEHRQGGSDQDSTDDPPPARLRNSAPTRVHDAAARLPVSPRGDEGHILVPAGRGIFAHPILAVNSDASSPVVLQADSGPIAGDRMIGTFAKQADRLVIHINSVVHQGENIGVDGVVIAPDTMEAGVASGIDQHYVERFALPAAAAFVAGLGQAIAQTSNTTAVLSPLGGATTTTNLNIKQQLGVAAGAAAQQIGSTLEQSAPKGPTISLEANVAVGVMFLSNVTSHGGP